MLCDCVRKAAPFRACHGAREVNLANWEEGITTGPSAQEVAKELALIEPTRALAGAQRAAVGTQHFDQGVVRHLSHYVKHYNALRLALSSIPTTHAGHISS